MIFWANVLPRVSSSLPAIYRAEPQTSKTRAAAILRRSSPFEWFHSGTYDRNPNKPQKSTWTQGIKLYIYKNRHLGLAARASHMFDKVCLCRAFVSANCCKSCSITFMFWYVFCWCLVKFAFVFLCLISRFYLRTKNKIYISQKPRIKHKYRQRVNRPKHYTNTNLTAHDVLLSHLKLAPWTCFMFCLRLVYIPFVCGCQDLKVSSQGHKFLDMRNVSAT